MGITMEGHDHRSLYLSRKYAFIYFQKFGTGQQAHAQIGRYVLHIGTERSPSGLVSLFSMLQ